MGTVALCLGSNLGDRAKYLRDGLFLIMSLRDTRALAQSSVHETAPWGDSTQGRYLNMAVLFETQLSPRELLCELLKIEKQLGRERDSRNRYGPRTFDADILFYDQCVIHEPDLVVPHPHMIEREFALAPLAEIAPDWEHPIARKSVRSMLAALTGKQGVTHGVGA